jgi:hypothetical protein
MGDAVAAAFYGRRGDECVICIGSSAYRGAFFSLDGDRQALQHAVRRRHVAISTNVAHRLFAKRRRQTEV